MSLTDTKIAVLGDGGWGTTLSLLLAEKGADVLLWGAFPAYVEEMRRKKENVKFLPGFRLPARLKLSSSIAEASARDVIVLATPSQHVRSVLKRLDRRAVSKKTFVIVAKGIETATLSTMSGALRDELGPVKFAVLSGPN